MGSNRLQFRVTLLPSFPPAAAHYHEQVDKLFGARTYIWTELLKTANRRILLLNYERKESHGRFKFKSPYWKNASSQDITTR